MAKIKRMPSEAIISGFKGVLDYYVWMGICCVRRWPRSPGHRRAPAVEAQWSAFRYATNLWNTLTPEVQRLWVTMAAGTRLSGRDLCHRAYISGTFNHPPP